MKPLLYVVVGVVVLGGLFLLLRPRGQQQLPSEMTPASSPMPTVATPSPSPAPVETSEAPEFTLVIQQKKIVSGPTTIQVKKGQTITLRITADAPEEFHLHGYDKSVELTVGEPVTLSFTATIAGRFPFELERSKTDLGVLVVLPQ